MKIECDVIRDLLPLYVDKVTSQKTNEYIETHVSECAECKAELDKLQRNDPVQVDEYNKNLDDQKQLSDLGKKLKRLETKSFLKGIALISVLLLGLYWTYIGLFHTYIISAPADTIEISNITDLGNDNIFYCINYEKGNYQEETMTEPGENGELYIRVVRPIIKSLSSNNTGCRIFQRGEYESYYDMAFTSYYYGTPDNRILIWKEGIVLPEPTREVAMIIARNFSVEIALPYLK